MALPGGNLKRPKAIIFDLMGTCLDWHSTIVPVLTNALQKHRGNDQSNDRDVRNDCPKLALEWRQGFFDEIHARFQAGEPSEDIDITHRRVLLRLLGDSPWKAYDGLADEDVDGCVNAWHRQIGIILIVYFESEATDVT
jgi:FMN phosphatase YigB (HAD superfamily)